MEKVKIPSEQDAIKMFGIISIQDLKGGPRCCFTSCTRCTCNSTSSAEEVLDS